MDFTIAVHNDYCQLTPRVAAEVSHALDEMMAFGIAGAKYSAAYTANMWDGRRHLYSHAKQIWPTGYLPDVVAKLQELGVPFTIADKRIAPALTDPVLPLQMPPWEHQKKIFEVCSKNPRGLIQASTGSGKTAAMAGVWGMFNVPGVILTFRKELMYQLRDHISRYLGTPVGVFGDGQYEPQRLTVCMVPSLLKVAGKQYARLLKDFEEGDSKTDDIIAARKLEIHKRLIHDIQFVVVDEAHHSGSRGTYQLLMSFKNAYYRYGMSATAFGYRDDEQDYYTKAATWDIITRVTTSDLVAAGHLVPTDVVEIPFSHKGLKHSRNSYHEYYDSAVIKNDARNKAIVEMAYGLFQKGQKVLIAVQRVDHGRLLAEYLEYLAGPHNVKFVYGDDDTTYRKEHLTSFADEKLPILISTLVGEGWDVPWMKYVINCRGEESRIATIQLMGRSMRKYPGKERATYIDIMDTATTWLARHARTRAGVYASEPAFNRISVQPQDIGSFINHHVK